MTTEHTLDAKAQARFWAKVDVRGPDDCWPWLASLDTSGYGRIGLKDKILKASRVAWALAHGPIPDGIKVCHECDAPACCNERHLFLGTQKENMQDSLAKGRHWSRTQPEERRGSRHKDAKLDEWGACGVMAMRLMDIPQPQIASDLGVTPSTISKIYTGRSWKHLFKGENWDE